MIKVAITAVTVCVLSLSHAHAASKSVKAQVPAGRQLLVLAKSDGTVARTSNSGKVSATLSAGSSGRLYLVNSSSGDLDANIILAIKKGSKFYTWKEAKSQKLCKGSARAVYGFSIKGSSLNVGSVKRKTGWGYTTAALKKAQLDKTALGTINTRCEPTATAANLGFGGASAQRIKARKKILIQAEAQDSDSDGLANVLDADDDNDGTMDSYDPDTVFSTPPTGTVATNIRLFSNIKPEISSSLNAYTETVTDERIDTLVANSNLAIQVAGGSTLATELNCGGLAYCSTGGSGSNLSQPFPENFDSDSDGKGTIAPGGTGDFQLTTGASKSTIGGGDILIQEVDNGDGTTTSVPVMLNFIFNTTPAIASLEMNGTPYTPTYPATNGMLGSANAPFTAPGGWDQHLTITAYRPQRAGISAAGEGTFVDIGNSKITIDIPNNPCVASGGGGCSGQNTSRCSITSYSESDTNLELVGEGPKDLRADQDTNTSDPTSNQIVFTVDLSSCISETWDSGEKLGIDLQFSNDVGDNAAQKFYIQLP